MRLSLADALFYALMVGAGEVYFLADAVRLGATSLEQALVITLPLCVGTLGPLMALGLLGRFRRRKAVVVSAATLQALILFTIVLTDTKGTLSPRVLIGLASAYQMCAQAAGTAWASWYGDLVPARVRGRYFATRNRIAQVATSGSLIVAAAFQLTGSLLGGWLLMSVDRNFLVVFVVSAACRLGGGMQSRPMRVDEETPSASESQ
jgi:hypothetical protein